MPKFFAVSFPSSGSPNSRGGQYPASPAPCENSFLPIISMANPVTIFPATTSCTPTPKCAQAELLGHPRIPLPSQPTDSLLIRKIPFPHI